MGEPSKEAMKAAREVFQCPNIACERGLDHGHTCASCGGDYRPDEDAVAKAFDAFAADAVRAERAKLLAEREAQYRWVEAEARLQEREAIATNMEKRADAIDCTGNQSAVKRHPGMEQAFRTAAVTLREEVATVRARGETKGGGNGGVRKTHRG
jgi:hypothetical protein